jgi:Domain of unknown function (DUF4157)
MAHERVTARRNPDWSSDSRLEPPQKAVLEETTSMTPDHSLGTYTVLPASGDPLPIRTQQQMQRAFNHDFSDVRVFESPRAANLDALAFAQGNQLHFQPGQYDPWSPQGQALLGHELAHVVQQRSGQVRASTMTPQGEGINDDVELEREAQEAGQRAARGERVTPRGEATTTGAAVSSDRGTGAVRVQMQEPRVESANPLQLAIAQVRFKPHDISKKPVVHTVEFGGRPAAKVLGGNGQGKHSTSYVVFEQSLRNAMFDKSFEDAVFSVMDLMLAIQYLPGLQRMRKEDQAYIQDLIDTAYKKYMPYHSTPPEGEYKAGILEDLCEDYLKIRNQIGYTAFGSGDNITTDRVGNQQLDNIQLNPDMGGQLNTSEMTDLVKKMMLVFDLNPPSQYSTPESAAITAAQHVQTIHRAYPQIREVDQKHLAEGFADHYKTIAGAKFSWAVSDQTTFKTEMLKFF